MSDMTDEWIVDLVAEGYFQHGGFGTMSSCRAKARETLDGRYSEIRADARQQAATDIMSEAPTKAPHDDWQVCCCAGCVEVAAYLDAASIAKGGR